MGRALPGSALDWSPHRERSCGRQVRVAARQPILTPDLPEVPIVDSDLDQFGSGSSLWSALKALPLKQRQSVAYHYLGGLPYNEIAEVLGGTAEAARKAASDGIARLRRTYLDGEQS